MFQLSNNKHLKPESIFKEIRNHSESSCIVNTEFTDNDSEEKASLREITQGSGRRAEGNCY